VRTLLYLLLLLLIACKRNGNEYRDPNVVVLHDSIKATSWPAECQLDLDRDGSEDIFVSAKEVYWQNWQSSFYLVKALNAETKVHVITGQQAMCEDSVLLGGIKHAMVHNCDGGPSVVRIDSFTYTPNLSLQELSTTSVQTIVGDTMLIEESYISNPMPPAPPFPVTYTSYVHGFFAKSSSGYLLFSIKGKRFALFIRKKIPYIYFEEIRRID
jgi:hypothetical protein